MEEKEISDLMFSDPDKLFQIFDSVGGSWEGLKKLKIGQLFARQRFPELVTQESIDASEFVFWFAYFAEREIRDSIFEVEKALGKNPQETEDMLDEMTFGKKIKFIEEHYIGDRNSDPYVLFLRSVNDLRNHLAHGRLDKLEYGGYLLSDPRGQLKLGVHLRNSSIKKGPTK